MDDNLLNVMRDKMSSQSDNLNNAIQNATANENVKDMISNFPPGKIFATVVFSLIGMSYFIYGKKQAQLTMIICGAALMVTGYLFSQTFHIVLAGIAIAALPHVLKKI